MFEIKKYYYFIIKFAAHYHMLYQFYFIHTKLNELF